VGRLTPIQNLSAVMVGLAATAVFMYFPIPSFIVLAGVLVFGKTRLLKPVSWPLLGGVILGLGLAAWIFQTS
jgi:hypothetical protein